jgi:hypothetical protein
VEGEEADLQMEAGLMSESRGCFSIKEDRTSLELICRSVAEESSLQGRYEVLELNGLTNRAEADNFLMENNLYLEREVESVAHTRDTSNSPSKRRKASRLKKQMNMHSFFKVRK